MYCRDTFVCVFFLRGIFMHVLMHSFYLFYFMLKNVTDYTCVYVCLCGGEGDDCL